MRDKRAEERIRLAQLAAWVEQHDRWIASHFADILKPRKPHKNKSSD
jgi:hypothetical protein